MGKFVTVSDFLVGDILISTSSTTEDDLKVFIDDIELDLRKLFGLELYDLFIADLDVDNKPQSQRFIDVFDEFYEDPEDSIGWCGKSSESEGIKKMLMRFIYVDFSNEQPNIPTSTGTQTSTRDNAATVKGPEYGIQTKYNIGVTSYQAIARKMILDPDTYPEYKGIAKGKVGMI